MTTLNVKEALDLINQNVINNIDYDVVSHDDIDDMENCYGRETAMLVVLVEMYQQVTLNGICGYFENHSYSIEYE